MEIERKWLIDIDKLPFDLSKAESFDIEQSYISFSPTIRLRRIVNLNKNILTMKSSSKNGGLSREEYEMEINNKQYIDLLKKIEGNTIYKTRYRIPVDDLIYEIDIFKKQLSGFAYMEIEFKDEKQALSYKPPIYVKKELTYDSRYNNAALASLNYQEIQEFINEDLHH